MSLLSSPSGARTAAVSSPTTAATSLICLLGTLTALGPLSIDLYLPAFPAIGREFGTGAEEVQQTLALFFVGMASGQLLYGPLSDRWGRKGPLLFGLLLYALASVGCALAPGAAALAWWRLLQGLGGCAGMVITRAIVRDRFGEVDAARVFSQMMMVMGIAPILAPFAGGQILAHLGGWRTLFWLLAAFGLGCAALVSAFLPVPERALAPAASARPAGILRTFAAIVRDPRFLVPTLILSGAQAAMFCYIAGSPGILIEHFGVGPQRYGLFFGANAAGLIATSQVNRLLLRRFSPHRIAGAGIAAAAAFGLLLALFSWSGHASLPGVAVLFFLLLAAVGFVGANGAAWAMAHQGRHAGSASALMGSVSFAFSAAAGGTIAVFTRTLHGDALRATGLAIALLAGASFILYRTHSHLASEAPLRVGEE